jgi:CDP-diacylglycerol--glycerol-3-phosphate 3-phosphatidyltransferase
VIELRVRHRIDVLIAPIGRTLARIGLRPLHLTLGGLFVTLLGAVLLARGQTTGGALIMLAGSAMDGLDGAVARASGTASARGALVDSVSDRIGETAMFGACAFWLTARASPDVGEPALVTLTVLSLAAGLLVSYLRAKAETSGADGRGGLMGRAERVILFTGGFLLGQVRIMLWAMVILTWLTVGQRFVKTWRQLGD